MRYIVILCRYYAVLYGFVLDHHTHGGKHVCESRSAYLYQIAEKLEVWLNTSDELVISRYWIILPLYLGAACYNT